MPGLIKRDGHCPKKLSSACIDKIYCTLSIKNSYFSGHISFTYISFTLGQLHNCNCTVIAIIDLYLVVKSVDKVFESLLYRKVMATMDSHFYYNMAAYRKQYCCETL